MGTILFHIFESTLCLTILYFLFRLFFRKDTHFRTNRLLLLIGTVACTLLPLMQIDVSQYTPLQLPVTAVRNLLTEKEAGVVDKGEEVSKEYPFEGTGAFFVDEEENSIKESRGSVMSAIPVTLLLGGCYLLGAFVVFSFLLLSTIHMYRLIHRFPAHEYGEYRLVICPEKIVSFSWGKTIVLSQEDYERNPEEILLHEQMHLQHRHTLDLLWMECLVILHWFNPAAWLLMRELREVHEYEADNSVINHGIDATQYQLLLVKKSVGTRLYSMACGFNHSKLKNRITMMLKRRTNNWARLKLLLFVPAAAGTLYAFARPEVKKTVEQAIAPVSVKQDPVQNSELEQLETFFKEKNDAFFEARSAGSGEKVVKLDDKSLMLLPRFFVNMNNKMMLNDELIKEYDVSALSSRFTNYLREGYKDNKKDYRDLVVRLSVWYDRGSSSDAITSYLRTIKDSYLQVRGEISGQLGGVAEARLDSIFPILVHFEKPKTYSPKGKTATDISLPIQISLFFGGSAGPVLKNPSLREVEQRLKEYKATTGADHLAVSLKLDKDVAMGVVEDVKEVIRNTLYGK